ncbi:3',5'-nucleoside bisphosphate phosphatase [Derxia gummosa]|uniref:3',5'-nucleoside bisphosphate phosphatase n=1 Tax=Derxia gummosa DSM 723 TaxID=1121388 RepID=A0A8B6X8K4_9BURK|nr:3',5'-nucleoside bisphosphate phosphatase [Derxia gummosa]
MTAIHLSRPPQPRTPFDPYTVNVDLHCHSNISDGIHEPEDVVERAHRNGVQWFALTDHDEVGGVARARQRATELGMGFIHGVEVSVTWAGETVHIVGLGIDITDPALVAGLERTRGGRAGRAQEMADGLAAVGIPGAYEGAMKYVGNPELISRSHFARWLVEIGRCDDVREVFGNYLVEGRPGYVPHRWAKLKEAIGWIRGAGGVAVIAHPGRYRFSDLERHAFIAEFKEAGGEGIEVLCASHTADDARRAVLAAREFDLKASRGSDFHGAGESRVEPGMLGPLPDSVEPIWAQWGIG